MQETWRTKKLVSSASASAIDLYKLFKQAFAKVGDNIVVVIHHDAQRLAQYQRQPHGGVAEPRPQSMTHQMRQQR